MIKRTIINSVATSVLLACLAAVASASKSGNDQHGVASVYSGGRTANGERASPGRLTAAHRSLPFGTMVRVLNRSTGRSVVVRINDRGPFVDDREMDVSYLVASRLGLLGNGVSKVRIELLEVPQRP